MNTDDLLALMATVLFYDGKWHARARRAREFCEGSTPREAMELAAAERREPPTPTGGFEFTRTRRRTF